MNMAPDYTDRPASKMSTQKKTLIGCGIGCATLIGLFFIIVGFGGWWLFSQEDQVPTDRILNTGSSGAFRLEDISENQEVMQLVSDVSREARRFNSKEMPNLPGYLEDLKVYFENQDDPAKLVEFLAPKEATLSLSSDEAGDASFIIAANFGKGTRIPKLFLNSVFKSNEYLKNKKISTEHGDLFIFDQKNDWNGNASETFIIGFYKGTFIFGNNPESALSALDRLAEEGSTGALNETLSAPFYRAGREGSLAYGVFDSSQLKILNHSIGTFSDELGSGMKKAEISLDKLSGDKGIVSLRMDWKSRDFAVKAGEEIEKLKTEWIKKAEQEGFYMEIVNSLNDEQLDIKFQVNDLKGSLINMMRNMD